MEPQWHQETSSKGIQPKHLPHFETAGHQLDWEFRKKARQVLVSASSLALLILVGLVSLFFLPRSLKSHGGNFAQLPPSEREQPFKGRIKMHVRSTKRKTQVPGPLFTSSTARDGFVYIVTELTIINRSSDRYMLNPFSFGLYTSDGVQYRTDLITHNHPQRLKNRKIEVGGEFSGVIIFQVPKQVRLKSLELMGVSDTISKADL